MSSTFSVAQCLSSRASTIQYAPLVSYFCEEHLALSYVYYHATLYSTTSSTACHQTYLER